MMALEATWLLTQDADPGGTTLVDSHNDFNELTHLAMLWMVRHSWLTGTRFTFNCYRHWEQLIIRHPGDVPFILLIREWFTQVEPLSIVLYGITLVPLVEEPRDATPILVPPFYDNDTAFYWSVRCGKAQLTF